MQTTFMESASATSQKLSSLERRVSSLDRKLSQRDVIIEMLRKELSRKDDIIRELQAKISPPDDVILPTDDTEDQKNVIIESRDLGEDIEQDPEVEIVISTEENSDSSQDELKDIPITSDSETSKRRCKIADALEHLIGGSISGCNLVVDWSFEGIIGEKSLSDVAKIVQMIVADEYDTSIADLDPLGRGFSTKKIGLEENKKVAVRRHGIRGNRKVLTMRRFIPRINSFLQVWNGLKMVTYPREEGDRIVIK